MKMQSKSWLSLLAIGAIVWACAPTAQPSAPISEIKKEIGQEITTPKVIEVVSYAKDIQPIMEESCVKCHQPGKKTPYLTTYESVMKNAKKGELYESVKDGYMPKKADKLAQHKIDAIQKWTETGYQP
jgi:mono/diheme cytochrome c family protein